MRNKSATLIDNIFVSTLEMVLVRTSVSYISDHFSQFCILNSIVNQTKGESRKVRDLSRIDWNEILKGDNSDADRTFSVLL